MTNKEKYKRAFSVLHASENMILEVMDMENRKKAYEKKLLAAGAAVAVLFGSMTAAYAADIGGIQEKLTMWFHGEEVEVTSSAYGDNSYKYSFTDSDGNTEEFVAGGVTIDDQGNEHPRSAQEILEDLADSITYTDEGRVKLFYYDKEQEIDITDLFDADGVCRVAVQDGEKLVYFTVRDNGDGDFDFEKTADAPKDAELYTVVK